jgi:hypothetical protein
MVLGISRNVFNALSPLHSAHSRNHQTGAAASPPGNTPESTTTLSLSTSTPRRSQGVLPSFGLTGLLSLLGVSALSPAALATPPANPVAIPAELQGDTNTIQLATPTYNSKMPRRRGSSASSVSALTPKQLATDARQFKAQGFPTGGLRDKQISFLSQLVKAGNLKIVDGKPLFLGHIPELKNQPKNKAAEKLHHFLKQNPHAGVAEANTVLSAVGISPSSVGFLNGDNPPYRFLTVGQLRDLAGWPRSGINLNVPGEPPKAVLIADSFSLSNHGSYVTQTFIQNPEVPDDMTLLLADVNKQPTLPNSIETWRSTEALRVSRLIEAAGQFNFVASNHSFSMLLDNVTLSQYLALPVPFDSNIPTHNQLFRNFVQSISAANPTYAAIGQHLNAVEAAEPFMDVVISSGNTSAATPSIWAVNLIGAPVNTATMVCAPQGYAVLNGCDAKVSGTSFLLLPDGRVGSVQGTSFSAPTIASVISANSGNREANWRNQRLDPADVPSLRYFLFTPGPGDGQIVTTVGQPARTNMYQGALRQGL